MPEILCPFDNTSLKRAEDRYNLSYFSCPKCGQEYSRYEVDDLKKTMKERVESARRELREMSQRKRTLVRILGLVE